MFWLYPVHTEWLVGMSSDNIVSLCYSVESPSSHEGVDDDKMPLDMKLIKSTKRSLFAG